ncbi:MAG: IclR family transcriptional regulator C-terminal domain-containing protein, partial [Dehalococcoidia bacterium]|nr:IclR family transcriptional regulator C-terminal domain-containing protein [Dehalococcoidia bacterium]
IYDEEYNLGVRAAAAPIRDHSGKVVAAITVAGPATRVSIEQLIELGEAVRKTSEEISYKLGFLPSEASI